MVTNSPLKDSTISLNPMESKEPQALHKKRTAKVRDWLSDSDGLLVTFDSVVIEWLSGFTGSNGCIFLDNDDFILFTDSRYKLQAPEEIKQFGVDARCVITADPYSEISEISKSRVIYLDGERISWAQKKKLSEKLQGKITDTQSPIRELRSIKDPHEVQAIATAANIADRALTQTIETIEMPITEKQFAAIIDHKLQLLGASGPAYPTIVAAGSNSAFPHATPTDSVINENAMILVDVGAQYNGYRSDMTRMIPTGSLTQEQNEMIELVLEAQKVAISEVRPGILGKEIDHACRTYLKENGFGENFTHGTGHGVGLEIHEYPRINSKSEDLIEEGMVITIEPGIYLDGKYGIRWEDLLLVTSDGVEFLTKSEKLTQL